MKLNSSGAFWFTFNAMNTSGARHIKQGFRAWLAWGFRRLADRIDGAESLTVEIESEPAVSVDDQVAILQCGLTHSRNLFVERVKQEAAEQVMREALPSLFRSEQ